MCVLQILRVSMKCPKFCFYTCMHVCIDVCAPNSECIDEVSPILLLHMYACVYRCVRSKFRVSMCVFQITAAEYASIGVSSLRLQLSDCGSMVAARLGMKVMKANNIEAYKEETLPELVKLVDSV